jgi:dipeptidyl aminopeptidase/acylaminoacyl peptidase
MIRQGWLGVIAAASAAAIATGCGATGDAAGSPACVADEEGTSRLLALVGSPEQPGIHLAVVKDAPPRDGREPKLVPLTKGDDRSPSWSNDGEVFAFARGSDLDHTRIYVATYDPADPDCVRDLRAVGYGTSPSVSPDGAAIAFLRRDYVYVMKIGGSKPRRVVEVLAAASVTWEPSARRLLVSGAGGLVWVDVVSGAVTPVRGSDPLMADPAIHPEQGVLVSRLDPRRGEAVIELVSDEARVSVTDGPWDAMPAPSPDGALLAFARQRPEAELTDWASWSVVVQDSTGQTVARFQGLREPQWVPAG